MSFIKYPEEPGCHSYVVPFFSLVDAILNNRREVISLFIVDFVQEYLAGVPLARQMDYLETVKDVNVFVLNSYPDEGQIGRATWPISTSLSEGGERVVFCHSWEGQNLH